MTDDVSNNENILMNDESTLLAQTTSNHFFLLPILTYDNLWSQKLPNSDHFKLKKPSFYNKVKFQSNKEVKSPSPNFCSRLFLENVVNIWPT